MNGAGKAVGSILAGNVIYLIGWIVILSIGDVLPAELLSGAVFDVSSIVDAYLIVGGLLGVVDILIVLSLIGRLNSGF
jgi:hypothetical protein